MSDTLMICDFVASMRHAGYLTFAAAVLGLAEAHYPELRNAIRRAAACVMIARRATMQRWAAVPGRHISGEIYAASRL